MLRMLYHLSSISNYQKDDNENTPILLRRRWTGVPSGKKTSDSENADGVMPLNEDPRKLQLFIDHPGDSMGIFGIGFRSSKFKLLLQEWIGSAQECCCQRKTR